MIIIALFDENVGAFGVVRIRTYPLAGEGPGRVGGVHTSSSCDGGGGAWGCHGALLHLVEHIFGALLPIMQTHKHKRGVANLCLQSSARTHEDFSIHLSAQFHK